MIIRRKSKIKRFFYNVTDGVKNLIKWAPVIWKDRDWDQAFLYEIMRHKLKLMEDYFYSDHTMCVDAKKRAEEIKTCRILLDRILKEEYIEFDPNKCPYPWDYFKNEAYMLKQDIDYLFKIMSKRSSDWWD